jgi:gamma-glutamyltranspeptidase/glutathione hydrolase
MPFAFSIPPKTKLSKRWTQSGVRRYAASLDFCRKNGFKEMPQRGIHSVTVPGAVHGWATLLNSHGTKQLSEVLQAAIRHADEGFPVAELTAEQWKESDVALKADEGGAINYLIDGHAPKAGESFP